MSDRGFVLVALNTDTDYTRLAYACALSIKHSQPVDNNHVTVFTNTPDAFAQYAVSGAIDNIQLYHGPEGMDSRSRIHDITPYEHTVFLDSDMLILDAIDWDTLSSYYLYVASTAVDFRNNLIVGYGPYRKVFEQYQLPNLYNAFTYFKKSDPRAIEFFNLVKIITDNPRAFISKFLPGSILLTMPTDEAFAIAAKILDIDEDITSDLIKVTHMKPALQGWSSGEDWTSHVRLDITNQAVTRIGVWPQHGLLHYVDKQAIDDTMLLTLEELACKKI
jgi:hypothetical protein